MRSSTFVGGANISLATLSLSTVEGGPFSLPSLMAHHSSVPCFGVPTVPNRIQTEPLLLPNGRARGAPVARLRPRYLCNEVSA